MIPDNLIFISAQPHDLYFQWQIEVQITNFRKFGISNRMQILVWYPKGNTSLLDNWKALQEKYREVSFNYFEDEGVNLKLYIPQLRPHILKRFFKRHGSKLSDKIFFYCDSDIIFNYLPDFEKLCLDNINWQSNTSSYLDYKYMERKQDQGKIPDNEAIKKMCKIGNITTELFESYTGKTGGAQYILKGIDAEFWEDVERQCLNIREAFAFGQPDSINTRYFKNEAAGFQSWCADMWAVNMALWTRGKVTDVTPELEFSWATDTADTYSKKPIFHNAGVVNSSNGLFFKGAWISTSPIGKKHSVKKDSASFFYVKAIEEVK